MARPRKGTTRSRGRRGSGSPHREEYEGSLVRLRCEAAVTAGPWPAVGIVGAVSDRGKGVPSFDEMMDIALMEVDFDDPTTNVRGRRALAIAKPTPRGYRPRRSTINLTTRVCFLRANEEQARN